MSEKETFERYLVRLPGKGTELHEDINIKLAKLIAEIHRIKCSDTDDYNRACCDVDVLEASHELICLLVDNSDNLVFELRLFK